MSFLGTSEQLIGNLYIYAVWDVVQRLQLLRSRSRGDLWNELEDEFEDEFEDVFEENGSPSRTRTYDPMINSHLLYQLSYRGTEAAQCTKILAAGQ